MKRQKRRQPRRTATQQHRPIPPTADLTEKQPPQRRTITRTFTENLILSLVIFAAGVVFLAFQPIGPSRLLYVLEHIRDIHLVSASDLHTTPVGTEVLIQGHIWQHSQAQFRSFVAYVREEPGGRRWSVRDWKKAALVVELPDGLVQVTNTDYSLLTEGMLVEWRPEFRPFSKNERYRGLALGSPVVVFGRVIQQSDGLALVAEYVTGGTRAQLRQAMAREPAADDYNMIIGSGLVVGGSWILLVSALQAVVASRRSRVAPSGETMAAEQMEVE